MALSHNGILFSKGKEATADTMATWMGLTYQVKEVKCKSRDGKIPFRWKDWNVQNNTVVMEHRMTVVAWKPGEGYKDIFWAENFLYCVKIMGLHRCLHYAKLIVWYIYNLCMSLHIKYQYSSTEKKNEENGRRNNSTIKLQKWLKLAHHRPLIVLLAHHSSLKPQDS